MNEQLKGALQDLSKQLKKFGETLRSQKVDIFSIQRDINGLYANFARNLAWQIDFLLIFRKLPENVIEKRLQAIFSGVAEFIAAE